MNDIKRRQLIKMLGAGTVAIPVSALIGSLPSHAQDMVDPEGAQAKALQYIEVTAKEGQMCSNCTLYQGEDGSEAGGCALFPGQNVAAAGWCSAYVAKG